MHLEAPRAVEHPFVAPVPSPSISEHVFDNPENDQSLADVKRRSPGSGERWKWWSVVPGAA